MTCKLKNDCGNKYQCCHFCENKKCEVRCKDKYKKCDWYDDADPTTVDAQTPLFDFQKERAKKRCSENKVRKPFDPHKVELFTYKLGDLEVVRSKSCMDLVEAVNRISAKQRAHRELN